MLQLFWVFIVYWIVLGCFNAYLLCCPGVAQPVWYSAESHWLESHLYIGQPFFFLWEKNCPWCSLFVRVAFASRPRCWHAYYKRSCAPKLHPSLSSESSDVPSEQLSKTLDAILSDHASHPLASVRQSACTWLLCLVKHASRHPSMKVHTWWHTC